MRILLHICCAPCAVYTVQTLREEGHEVYGYFFNPNIHPYQEYLRRRDTLAEYAKSIDLPVIFEKGYNLEGFLREMVFRENDRCRFCCRLRLNQAAHIAKKGKFDAVTTTLLYSKFQKHELIAEIGRETSSRRNIDFLYRDFREGWKAGITKSKELNLYRQQYCGCIYSEKERFYKPGKQKKGQAPKSNRDYRG
ncbi:MAG: epoxyqueuosine reductase QueH [Deltaproteobacteria bacterium]|nr:epoxyqueuosine reductase QueH [Deltaproteobacteria bacterium]MBW2052635.1 epoxyqueuosine reductase QueH [Deltaproteobacteria bacterium]MBW2140556.1 epoxyqueuosine reductase QueH [Deltaproteobacteria bacterium]MBW2323056.1 epoxyqueuosine reductase QueH [Deltaproteobacteria bacterium]